MTALGENTPVRLALLISSCVAVAMISYQQGQIQASQPKEGQYVSSVVFAAVMGTVDTKLSSIKDSQEAGMKTLRDTQELRLQAVEKELARLRDDLARFIEGTDAPANR